MSLAWGTGVDGLRARYAPASSGLYYLFQFDPQGSLAQRQTGGPGGNTSYYALDTAMYDGYGKKLGDTDAFTGGPEPQRDAVGFQGQWGAYTDNETGLVLMGHRYYDPGVGRFLTRDPKGYGGGVNLYGFTGNDPVNEQDPDGLRPLTATDTGRLHRLASFAAKDGVAPRDVNGSVNAIKAAIAAVSPGATDPVSLRASFWAIDRLGDTRYGFEGTISDSGMSTIVATKPKCNIFVGNAYAYGGGLGFGGGGVPTTDTEKFFGLVHRIFPPSASDYANKSKKIGNFSFLSQVSSPSALSVQQVGDIVAFSHGGNHVTLSLGGDLLIYAGQYDVKVQTNTYVWGNEGRGFITNRRYLP